MSITYLVWLVIYLFVVILIPIAAVAGGIELYMYKKVLGKRIQRVEAQLEKDENRIKYYLFAAEYETVSA